MQQKSYLGIIKYLFIGYICLIPLDGISIIPFLSLSNIFIGLCFILLLQERKVVIRKSQYAPVLGVLGVIVFMMIITVFNCISMDLSSVLSRCRSLLFYFFIAMFYVVAWNLERTHTINKMTIIKAIIVSGFIVTLSGYAEFFYFFIFGSFYQEPYVLKLSNGFLIRMRGIYFDPNYFSFIVNFCLFLSFCMLKKGTLRTFLIVYFALAVVLTFSRMAILSLLCSIGLLFFSKIKNVKLRYGLFLLVICALCGTLGVLSSFFINLNSESSNDRMDILVNGFNAVLENPLWGYGFDKGVPIIFSGVLIEKESHNTFLQIMLYGGLISFTLFMLNMILGIKNLFLEQTSQYKMFKILSLPAFLFILLFISYFNIKYLWIYLYLFFSRWNQDYVFDSNKLNTNECFANSSCS